MQRREVLKSAAILGTSAVTGCCFEFDPIPESEAQVFFDDISSGSVNTFLAPAPYTPSSSVKLTSRVVDAHVHIYNASDWQVGGGISGPLSNTLPQSIRDVIRGVAPIIEKISQEISLSAADEIRRLNSWALLSEPDARSAAASYAQDHHEWLVDRLHSELGGSALADLITVILAIDGDIFTPGTEYSEFSQEFLNEAIEHSMTDYEIDMPLDPSQLESALGSEAQIVIGHLKALLGFLYHMTSPRFKNLLAFQNAYSAGGTIGVDQCYSSVLNFDYWVGDCDHPPSSMQDQIILMARISQLSGGYIRPLAAYNPWTDIKDNDDSIQMLAKAVTDYGFAGVKIYNQIGFYPYSNATQQHPASAKMPDDLGFLDEKLSHFFSVCRAHDIPVMTHSGDSMGRSMFENRKGGPDAWSLFFDAAENAGTRVNLAHFGGDHDGPTSPNWPTQFVEIMKKPGAEHLYGDIGKWLKLADGDIEALLRLTTLLAEPVSNGETAADRLMFGTDWLMLSAFASWNKYSEEVMQVLSAVLDQATLDKIMFANADKFFSATT